MLGVMARMCSSDATVGRAVLDGTRHGAGPVQRFGWLSLGRHTPVKWPCLGNPEPPATVGTFNCLHVPLRLTAVPKLAFALSYRLCLEASYNEGQVPRSLDEQESWWATSDIARQAPASATTAGFHRQGPALAPSIQRRQPPRQSTVTSRKLEPTFLARRHPGRQGSPLLQRQNRSSRRVNFHPFPPANTTPANPPASTPPLPPGIASSPSV